MAIARYDADTGVLIDTRSYSDMSYDTYGFLGGLYYDPVDQLTIGIEGEWYTTSFDYTVNKTDTLGNFVDKR